MQNCVDRHLQNILWRTGGGEHAKGIGLDDGISRSNGGRNNLAKKDTTDVSNKQLADRQPTTYKPHNRLTSNSRHVTSSLRPNTPTPLPAATEAKASKGKQRQAKASKGKQRQA